MLKKRKRVAKVAFSTLIAVTILFAVLWKVSETYRRGTGEIKIYTGTIEEIAGVNISVGIAERVWTVREDWQERENMDADAKYYYQTQTVEIDGTQAVTGLDYEKRESSDLRNRMYFSGLLVEFPKKEEEGLHIINGSEITYDAKVRLCDEFSQYFGTNRPEYWIKDYVTFEEEDRFLYYYDGQGSEQYEGFSLPLSSGYTYTGRYLSELDGALYGYLWMEPEYEYKCLYSDTGDGGSEASGNGAHASMTQEVWDFRSTCEKVSDSTFAETLSGFGMPEIHMKVNKGIYRFDEDGTATCVFQVGELEEEFSFLWLISEEEEKTLTVVGTKGNVLVAYVYSTETDTMEERILWNGGEEVTAWSEVADICVLADLVTEGERTYLCYTDVNLSKVYLSVFENENRVFEGEVLQEAYDSEKLQESFKNSYRENAVEAVADKLEITVTK